MRYLGIPVLIVAGQPLFTANNTTWKHEHYKHKGQKLCTNTHIQIQIQIHSHLLTYLTT